MCNGQELVSVIIPSYKGSENIVRAVQSVLDQTWKNIEVFVVDDNGLGTEEQIKTEKALKTLLQRDKRLSYVCHEINKNGSAARNTGFYKSKGAFIAYLDDDDVYYPNHIFECVEQLKKMPDEYGVVYSDFRWIYDNRYIQENVIGYEGDVFTDYALGKFVLTASIVILKRKVVEELQGYDETFKRHQDWEFLLRVFSRYKVAYVKMFTMDKYMYMRNNPKDPDVYKNNRVHFIEKMKPLFEKLPDDIRKSVYDRHYHDIAKMYVKAKKWRIAFLWIKKTSNPIWFFVKSMLDAFMLLKRKCLSTSAKRRRVSEGRN